MRRRYSGRHRGSVNRASGLDSRRAIVATEVAARPNRTGAVDEASGAGEARDRRGLVRTVDVLRVTAYTFTADRSPEGGFAALRPDAQASSALKGGRSGRGERTWPRGTYLIDPLRQARPRAQAAPSTTRPGAT